MREGTVPAHASLVMHEAVSALHSQCLPASHFLTKPMPSHPQFGYAPGQPLALHEARLKGKRFLATKQAKDMAPNGHPKRAAYIKSERKAGYWVRGSIAV